MPPLSLLEDGQPLAVLLLVDLAAGVPLGEPGLARRARRRCGVRCGDGRTNAMMTRRR